MDRIIDLAMRGFVPWPTFGFRGLGLFGEAKEWLPTTDVIQREREIVVRVDLPGVDQGDIEVSVEEDRLIIRGHRQETQERNEDNYLCLERATGDFYRSVYLPENALVDSIEATYENGVLEVIVPLIEPRRDKKRKVEIR